MLNSFPVSFSCFPQIKIEFFLCCGHTHYPSYRRPASVCEYRLLTSLVIYGLLFGKCKMSLTTLSTKNLILMCNSLFCFIKIQAVRNTPVCAKDRPYQVLNMSSDHCSIVLSLGLHDWLQNKSGCRQQMNSRMTRVKRVGSALAL